MPTSGDGMTGASAAAMGYGLWLVAGLADFILHRRANLAHTSGMAESALHLVQLLLVGLGILLWLYMQPSRPLLILWTAIATLHAAVGYLDTSVAYPRRRIGPLEQHVHSALDMAPWIAVACLWWLHGREESTAAIALREPAFSTLHQAGVLLPAAVLTGVPAMVEFVHAWRVRTRRH